MKCLRFFLSEFCLVLLIGTERFPERKKNIIFNWNSLVSKSDVTSVSMFEKSILTNDVKRKLSGCLRNSVLVVFIKKMMVRVSCVCWSCCGQGKQRLMY